MSIIIHWFRQDLRLTDNPALYEAAKQGDVLPVYIDDSKNTIGSASRWWLHHSLESLNKSLDGKLHIFQGDTLIILEKLITAHHASALYWNRCYEPWRIKQDKSVEKQFKNHLELQSYNASLLWEPWETLKQDGTPYKVFTPFFKKGCVQAAPPRKPLPVPPKLSIAALQPDKTIASLKLLPKIGWDKQLLPHWSIGEKAAQTQLKRFIENSLSQYKEGRNFPAKPYVSRLSPYLHTGELSPNQAWYAVKGKRENEEHFLSELGWREFSYNLLYHFPDLPRKNLQEKFNRFPWRNNAKALKCWQMGQTGYPIVDAGMRELWKTGYMHNRVRMIVGSFLVKNLLLHWHHGEAWFWDCLVDADLANNSASWQWIAGCGADAAPYFRIFNPVTQSQKFDPKGVYIKTYLPELEHLPTKYIAAPWEAPESVLVKANITLGKTYPHPIVDLKVSREQALSAFSQLKN